MENKQNEMKQKYNEILQMKEKGTRKQNPYKVARSIVIIINAIIVFIYLYVNKPYSITDKLYICLASAGTAIVHSIIYTILMSWVIFFFRSIIPGFIMTLTNRGYITQVSEPRFYVEDSCKHRIQKHIDNGDDGEEFYWLLTMLRVDFYESVENDIWTVFITIILNVALLYTGYFNAFLNIIK